MSTDQQELDWLRAVVAARRDDPADDREQAAATRFLGELDRLAAPLDEHADAVHVTASAIVVSPDGARILLHRHKRLGLWLQPGGHIAPGERVVEAAHREVVEETGLIPEPVGGEPADAVVHIDVHEGGRGHTHLDVRFVFVGIGELAPATGESLDVRWFSWDDAAAIADPGLAGALPPVRQLVTGR